MPCAAMAHSTKCSNDWEMANKISDRRRSSTGKSRIKQEILSEKKVSLRLSQTWAISKHNLRGKLDAPSESPKTDGWDVQK